jgi:radical SAM superfamily enzyme YgiQ (UPF0313 family)
VSGECEFLGIEYLSAALKGKGHSTFLTLDPKLFATELTTVPCLSRLFDLTNKILADIDAVKPGLICFSVSSDSLGWALRLAHRIKKDHDVPIIFGGIHPTIMPEETIADEGVDYICVGEGEEAIVELAESIANKRPTRSIPNIWAKQDNQIYRNPVRPLIRDLDALPFPDKSLYAEVYPRFMSGYKIATSRGCPYLCSYCANHQLIDLYKNNGRFLRRRSVANVIEELKLAKEKYKIKMVRFFDDVFTHDKRWLREFAEAYKSDINLPFFCFIHPKDCDKEVVKLLESCNCKTVFMGFGTFCEDYKETLLKRDYSNQKVSEIINLFSKSKIYLLVDFMLGLPGQTKEDVIQMAHFFNENRPDVLSGLFLRYYPKTGITAYTYEKGVLNSSHARLVNEGTFQDRIIIEAKFYQWLKKLQGLILLSRYLPRFMVKFFIKTRFYNIFPSLDTNNFFVIVDSVLPKFTGKRRIHTDTISPLQHLHFYCHHIKLKLFS